MAIKAVMTCTLWLLLACTAPGSTPTRDLAKDVRAWVKAYEETWNAHDASAVATFFSEDADFIVGNGPRLVGRQAIENSWRRYFAGIDGRRTGTFAVASVRVIAPRVVLVNVNSTTAGSGAKDQLPTRLARGTWVVIREGGRWQILAFRAQPAVGDVRVSPGRDR